MNKFMSTFNRTPGLNTKHHWVPTALAVGGGVSTLLGASGMSKAKQYLRENKALWEALQTPNLNNLQVQLEQAVAQGKLDPQLSQAILADPSFMKDIGANPELVKAQEQTLTRLQGISGARGQDATTRARMAETMGQVCLLYTSPSPRDRQKSRMPSSA